MSKDLSDVQDFLSDDGGFKTPPMPSATHPEGYQYRVPSPDAITGLRLSALADLSLKYHEKQDVTESDVKRLQLNDDDERDFIQQVLSPELVEEMKGDGVRWEHMRRLSMYAYILFTAGEDAAEKAREGGLLQGKAPSPNRAQRRSKKAGAGTATRGASQGSRKAPAKKA